MVQTNTAQGPGGEAGVMRLKGTQRGLAMALDGNSRWCYLDSKLGAAHAVAEAARKVACTGATPIAATNCLNFGNPEKPEIMAQLSSAIDGIAEACTALGTPITGGNVSLYNETKGEAIYPTPVLGIVGILEDVSKAVPADFQRVGDAVLLLRPKSQAGGGATVEFGSSEYAKLFLNALWGTPPTLSLEAEASLHKCLAKLADERLLNSARDISDGGIAVALPEGCFAKQVGVRVEVPGGLTADPVACALFAEHAGEVLISCAPESVDKIKAIVDDFGFTTSLNLGSTTADQVEISVNGQPVISESIANLFEPWRRGLPDALESTFHCESSAMNQA
jgi:phosphoribosylformylglycinamidine synthase